MLCLSLFLSSICVSVHQLEMQPHTQQTIYGLNIGKEYEVHIRCRMPAFIKFGQFSDSIFIQVTEIPTKGKSMVCVCVLLLSLGDVQCGKE